MLSIEKGTIVFHYKFCQQCGICYTICPKRAINLTPIDNGTHKVTINRELCVLCKKCVSVCPSQRKLTCGDYLSQLQDSTFYLGSNKDEIIRKKSSSGGVCKTLIIESLKRGIVDGVYSLRKINKQPWAEGEFYTKENIPDYEEIPNSIYHSILACKEISKIKKSHSLMIVGTSCQLYAIEKALKGQYEELIKVCIFCKQQKNIKSTLWLAKMMGVKSVDAKNTITTYRGEGWPGTVKIMEKQTPWEYAAVMPFGRRLWCIPGCDICGDPFGIESGADITLMDPWQISKRNDLGETLICVHTEKGDKLLRNVGSLNIDFKKYSQIEPALGLNDIWRKRKLVPFFREEKVNPLIEKAGVADIKQRRFLEKALFLLPSVPYLIIRILNKLYPVKRDKILKAVQDGC